MDLDKLKVVARQGARHGTKILVLSGPLTIRTMFALQNAVQGETSPVLILDFSDVPFTDSAGLGVLVGAGVTAQNAGRKLILAGVNDRVNTLLELSHLQQFFVTFVTVEEAEAAIA